MAELSVGMAKVVITPPVGSKLSGYAGRTDPSIGVLDDLYARGLVLSAGETRLALVVCDLIGLGRDMVAEIRAAVEAQTGIGADQVMIACTHTHCGPNLDAAVSSYVEGLKHDISGVVAAAANCAKPARIGFARGACGVGANRRNPNSPSGPYNLYTWPEGTTDPTVMVLRADALDGSPIGVLTNHAAHPVALGHKELMISRDYPGFALEVLETVLGGDTVAMFLQGCCGNLNLNWIWDKPDESPMPPRRLPEELEPRLREARRLGNMLGGETLKVAESITEFVSDVDLGAARACVELRVRDQIPERMRGYIEKLKAEPPPAKTSRRRSIYRDIAAGKTTVTTEVQVFRVGDSCIVGLPSEVFVEYQMQVRERSGVAYAFVSELANDTISYVPTPEAYEQGGYEETVSLLAPGSGEVLVGVALELIETLQA